MSRAKWKGPYFYKTNTNISRNSEVLPYFVGSTVSVYNGKKDVDVKVTSEMVGHKFGEFVSTRVKFIFKKKNLKKKQYGAKNKS